MSVTGTTFTDTDVTSGVTYYNMVTALNSNGESLFSSEASAPDTPTALTATPQGGGVVTLNWVASAGPAPLSYNVHASTTSGQEVFLTNTGNHNTNYNVTSLTPGVTYYFTIAAVHGPDEVSPESDEASTTDTLDDSSPLFLAWLFSG